MSLLKRITTSAQAARFGRLFGAALLAQLVAVNGPITRDVLVASAIGAAEVAFRTVFPVSS